MESWTSRKFILACAVIVAGVVFVLVGKSSYEQWIQLASWVFGGFIVGNVAEKFSK